jgi:iron complex transport system substrate-binding protein
MRCGQRMPRGAALRLLLIVLLCACARDRAPQHGAISVTDDAGRIVTLPQPARRVISLIPAQTDIVAILAGPSALIARTQWDTDPRLVSLPIITDALTPSVEWLAAQQPDLVISWTDAQSRDVVDRLAALGVPVYASRVESIADIQEVIERLGVLLGAEGRADSMRAAIGAQLDSVRAQVRGRPQRSVLYLLSADPPMAAGPGTFVDEVIQLAGGTNVFGDLRQLWPQVSLEEIVRRQPDVIIRPTDGARDQPLAGLAGRPGWRELRAVQQGRVVAIDPYFYNRPGAAVGIVARDLAAIIHGDSVR